jgi:hypothetical protein
MALLTDMPEAVVAKLATEIQENRPEDSIVAVYDLGRRLDHPEWIIRVTGDMLQNRAFGVGTLSSLHEMPVLTKLFIKDVEGKFLSIKVGRDAPFIGLMRRSRRRFGISVAAKTFTIATVDTAPTVNPSGFV